jgi:acetylornithine deacetylase/succinyl-diaminopimelate desuccinylase-like protein
MRTALIIAALAAGCSGSAADDDVTVDGGDGDGDGDADAAPESPDGAVACAAIPDPAPAWLGDYQDDIVATLSSQSDRATVARRNTARTYLVGELEALGYTATVDTYSSGANVRAELAATEPGGPLLVVGAHFDTVPGSPGANDNATGVAMVLSAARYLQTVDCRKMSVVFYLFDQEEIGLVGSYYAADDVAADARPVAAVHTVDQMGWDSNDDRLIELELPTTAIRNAYTDAKTAGGFTAPIVQTSTDTTDHTRFRDLDLPATGVTEGYVSGDTTPHYHEPGDTYATVDFAYLEASSALFHLTLARTARSDAQGVAAGPVPAFVPRAACRGDRVTWAN